MSKYHFISGLPRSGSTLLAAILRQNPRFHAGMTSPVGSLFSGMLQQFAAGTEFGSTITVANIVVPKGVTIVNPGDDVIAIAQEPREEEIVEVAAPVEGAVVEGATPAEGAPVAEGAAAPAAEKPGKKE